MKQIITPELLEKARANTKATIPDYNAINLEYKCEAIQDNFVHQPSICDSVLDLLGKTPMVRLSRIAKVYGLECDLVAKCDFMSAGGSVKDRAVFRMIEDAEKQGILTPNKSILIEASSGNTGIAMALVGKLKGYHVIITLPEKMSQEKLDLIRGLGAEVIRTPTEAAWNNPESNIGLAKKLAATIPNAVNLDQYINPSNPGAHYSTTAVEILEQCDQKVDAVIMTTGTGGTLSGVAKRFKEVSPSTTIIGVDPIGSILAQPSELNENSGQTYLVEGIGYDFIPPTCQRKYIDKWIKTNDCESLKMAREILRLEGLLVGQSSGSVMVAAIKHAKSMKKGERCVVLFPDSIRNYMTKHLDIDYMIYHGFEPVPYSPSPFGNKTARDIQLSATPTISENVSCLEAVTTMNTFQMDHIPMVKDESGHIIGVVSMSLIHKGLLSGQFSNKDKAKRLLTKNVKKVYYDTRLTDIAHYLNVLPYCLLYSDENVFVSMITLKNLYCPGITE